VARVCWTEHQKEGSYTERAKEQALEIGTGVWSSFCLNTGLIMHKRKLPRLEKESSLRSNWDNIWSSPRPSDT